MTTDTTPTTQLPDPAPLLTEDTTLSQLELEMTRIGASIRSFPISAVGQRFHDDVPSHHRVCVFMTAESLSAYGTGQTIAEAANAALVRLRSSLQRMYEQNKLPPHVVVSPLDNELLS